MCDMGFFIHTSLPGAASCDSCTGGYYSDSAKCVRCPPGTDCGEVLNPDHQGSQLATISVKEGWFRLEPESTKVYKCSGNEARRNEACVGGDGTGDNLCGAGYEGLLCWVCSDSYYRDTFSEKCKPSAA